MNPVPCGVVTLLTDFGLTDPFAGIMKGVIVGRFPGVRIVDLSHAVPPQRVATAALWLELSVGWFPPGTVHVVVVDPGVGSERAAAVFRADGNLFVAPDNGVCDRALSRAAHVEARRVDLSGAFAAPPSRTFHGRDVFAPVAADLAAGVAPFEALGKPMDWVPKLTARRATADATGVRGEVVWIDHFGNLITNIDATLLAALGQSEVLVAGERRPIMETYASAQEGEVIGVVNSFGLLELAVRNGSAARQLNLDLGAEVRAVALRGA